MAQVELSNCVDPHLMENMLQNSWHLNQHYLLKLTDDLKHCVANCSISGIGDKLTYISSSLKAFHQSHKNLKKSSGFGGQVSLDPQEKELNQLQHVAIDIIDNICVPLLNLKLIQSEEYCNVVTKTIDIVGMLYIHLKNEKQEAILLLCSDCLERQILDTDFIGNKEVTVDIITFDTSLLLLNKVLNVIKENNLNLKTIDKIFGKSIEIIQVGDDKSAARIISIVIPHFLDTSEPLFNDRLITLFNLVLKSFEQHGQMTFETKTKNNTLSERPYLILCGLANYFFAMDVINPFRNNILNNRSFWNIIQCGLSHSSGLTRKRSNYLIKRILDLVQTQGLSVCDQQVEQNKVFWWDTASVKELSSVWEDYLLLIETMEEKQVHVIKPLMSRIHTLIKATSVRSDGAPYLHTSWLLALFQRIASHESANIKRWGALELLNIDLTTCPLFEQNQHAFFYGPLVGMLTESAIYHKPADVPLGQSVPVRSALLKFFQSCSEALVGPQKGEFFMKFLHGVSQRNWSGAALVYVVQGLADMSPSPTWDASALDIVRTIVTSGIASLEIHFRGAIEAFLLMACLNLLNADKVSPADFASLLGLFQREVTLKRGTSLWSDIVRWISSAAESSSLWDKPNVAIFLHRSLDQWLKVEGNNTDSYLITKEDHLPFVRFLVLAVDADLLPVGQPDSISETSSLEDFVKPVIDILLSINYHAYMPASKADRALAFVETLFQESRSHHDGAIETRMQKVTATTLTRCLAEILVFIQRRILDISMITEVSSLDLYLGIMRILPECGTEETIVNYAEFKELVNCCRNMLPSQTVDAPHQLSKVCSWQILAVVCDMFPERSSSHLSWSEDFLQFLSQWKVQTVFKKPPEIAGESRCEDRKSSEKLSWGKLSSSFIGSQWSCLKFWLQTDHKTLSRKNIDFSTYVDDCLSSLDLVGRNDILPIFGCLKLLLPKVSEEKAVEIVNVVWRRVKEESSYCKTFWPAYKIFIQLSFQSTTLTADAESLLSSTLTEIADEVFEIGEEKTGMVNILVDYLCHWWCEERMNAIHAYKLKNVIIKGILFGPVHSRGQRFMREVHRYLAELGNILPVNQLSYLHLKEDNVVRVQMLSFLSKLDTGTPAHVAVADFVIKELLIQQRQLLHTRSYRNFPNSLSHRQKHRLFCALSILEPYIASHNYELVFDFLLEILLMENQPSVRCLAEWILVRLLYYKPQNLDRIWKAFAYDTGKKGSCLCSLLTCLAHYAKLLPPQKLQDFAQCAIPKVTPWCMCHHFNLRTFSQATLITIWNLCKEHKLDTVLSQYDIVNSFVEFSIQQSNAVKNTHQLLENFFFKFHPLRDNSVETLVRTLPYLSSMTDEEWISPNLFIAVDPTWTDHSQHILPLYNSSDELKLCEPGAWKVNITGKSEKENFSEGDVQKKMVPWNCMIPDQELGLDFQEDYSKKKQPTGELILVTSLIDKIPNLGGLCRSCEIFGVAQFVVGNINFVEDKAFKMLSVTADKWIHIREIRQRHLESYLCGMRAEGYTLVGVEQTANSRCLTEFQFPLKTLLLLGNEKEGIPVELIQLLDACVEIPQQGMIRSLNVHVSGALLIWEYTRQQLMKKS